MALSVLDPDFDLIFQISNWNVDNQILEAGNQRLTDGVTGIAAGIIHYSIS
jgi:hypothetical protein